MKYELEGSLTVFDLDLDVLLAMPAQGYRFCDLPRFPDVPFEVSVIADGHTPAHDILASGKPGIESKLLRDSHVVTVYEGAPVPDGKKSVSLRYVFNSQEKTLSPDEILNLQNTVIGNLKRSGFALR